MGPRNITLAIAGNKSDLEEQRQVSREAATEYAELVDAVFVETSALTATNVQELFETISRRLPVEAFAPVKKETIQVTPAAPQKKAGGGGGGGCC